MNKYMKYLVFLPIIIILTSGIACAVKLQWDVDWLKTQVVSNSSVSTVQLSTLSDKVDNLSLQVTAQGQKLDDISYYIKNEG